MRDDDAVANFKAGYPGAVFGDFAHQLVAQNHSRSRTARVELEQISTAKSDDAQAQ
jgi:hypothetical protein